MNSRAGRCNPSQPQPAAVKVCSTLLYSSVHNTAGSAAQLCWWGGTEQTKTNSLSIASLGTDSSPVQSTVNHVGSADGITFAQ